MPCATEIEEKHSHKHVVEAQGQGIVESPHPVTD